MSDTDYCSIGGKIGGYNTKNNKLGIFSDSYDRGKQTKKNHELGLYDNVDYVKNGSLGGKQLIDNKIGIFEPDLQYKRTEWAKNAASKVINRGGYCSKSWRDKHEEQQKINCSNGGKIGGKKVGSMYWWNNGIVNKKSHEQPSDEYVRGMLMSDKKKSTLFGKGKEI